MKKTISIMIVSCMIAGATFGGRGTIKKDVSYFDADGSLVVPTLTATTIIADSLEVDDVDVSGKIDIITLETASAGTKIELSEGTNNGVHTVTIQAPAAVTSNRTITIPDANVDLGVIVAAGVLPAVDLSAGTNVTAANITPAGTLPQLDASALTAIDAANIATGDIAIARVTNALAGMINSASITHGAIAASQVITTSTVAVLDINGSTLADYAAIRVWVSATSAGVTSTNNVESLVLTGAQSAETVANGDYRQTTTSAGTLTATITSTAAPYTNFLNVSVGPYVVSEELELTVP